MDNSNDLEFDFSLCHEHSSETTSVNEINDYPYYRYCLCQGI
jgi:hypothetical protein